MLPPCLTSLSRCIYGIFLTLILCSSCTQEKEIVPEEFVPTNHHESYLYALEKAGLHQSALGIEWKKAAQSSLKYPMKIETPYAENFYFAPTEASGVGYRFSAQRGHQVEITIDVVSDDSLDIFLDVFRIDDDSLGQYTHIASAPKGELIVGFEPQINSEYIMRFQSELLRGGSFRVEIVTVPAFSFPVLGKDKSDIGSLFGVPRDGGKRKHHGVDIFAKRHTPIIAPTEGRIRRVGEGGIGGKVVWMRDTDRDQTLYFAHLEDILVKGGDYVYPGDTIGTVGNTGNARTTPPHLHFGIYQNGPIDPFNFIANTRTSFKNELADKNLVGQMVRTRSEARIRKSGVTRKVNTEKISRHQIMEVLGASSSYYRVRLPDLTQGYIAFDQIEKADKPINSPDLELNNLLLSNPKNTAHLMAKIERGEKINILGGNQDFYFVEQASGRKGWVQAL